MLMGMIMQIKITETAIMEFKRLLSLESHNKILRVSVYGGGCSGLSYKLEFDNEVQIDKDKILYDNEIIVIADNKTSLFINNLEIDYSGGLNGTGFTFNNPNAKRTCGCGTSFGI